MTNLFEGLLLCQVVSFFNVSAADTIRNHLHLLFCSNRIGFISLLCIPLLL